MAITSGNWSSSTDPFILATAFSYSGVVTDHTDNSIEFSTCVGAFNWDPSDKDNCEVIYQHELDKTKSFTINAHHYEGLSTNLEYPTFEHYDGSNWQPYDIFPRIQATGSLWRAFFTGKASGFEAYDLYAYFAYAWFERDPAQIIFSWIAHHCASEFTLKTYLNQTSFEDASDYYDQIDVKLSLLREVGSSIADQIKKVMQNTADFIGIRPDPADGDVEMFLFPRRSLTERTTAIDMTSTSIAGYTIRHTDRYTLDGLNARYGLAYAFRDTGGGALPDDSADYFYDFTDKTAPYIGVSRQRVRNEANDRVIEVEVPYIQRRIDCTKALDIGFWKDPQSEVEIQFADWSHLNFEIGDVVFLTGRGFTGARRFLVTEKDLSIDDLTATARFLQINESGPSPFTVDGPNLALAFRPNELGLFFNTGVTASGSLPDVGFLSSMPRPWDRLHNEAGNYAHAWQMDRGTGGPSSGNPQTWEIEEEKRNGWPGFALGVQGGMNLNPSLTTDEIDDYDSLSAKSYTAYFVGNPTNTGSGSRFLMDFNGSATDQLVLAISGAGTVGKVQFYDGSWKGTIDTVESWQILVFVLDGSGANLAKIRRNGADIETGLNYTNRRIAATASGDAALGCGSAGNGASYSGAWEEFLLFEGVHSSSQIAAIEAYLAEKYAITI